MLIVAAQSLASGISTVTPEEPTSLQLMLVGLGAMAIYALWTNWRPQRMHQRQPVETIGEDRQETLRRAA